MKSCPLPAAIVFAACIGIPARASVPDLVPMPKEYEALNGELALDGLPVFVDMQNRPSVIAAGELDLRIRELGGTPGETLEAGDAARPGIYVLPFDHAAARALAAEFDLAVAAGDPGPQGYVIHTAADRIAVIGSDSIGALYGAMTLRQMMRRSGDGGAAVDRARVYDKPDFHFRSQVSYRRGLQRWAQGEQDAEAALRAGIDTMMRFKLNVITDYLYSTEDPRDFSPDARARLRRINDYASERGIHSFLFEHTRVGVEKHDGERPDFEAWECVYVAGWGGGYYCWSRDALTRAKIEWTLDFVEECGFTILHAHPVDGGGPVDPEHWSRRCRLCRERFGDRRWEASAHQFNLWASAIRERGLDLVFNVPVYPYNALYASFDRIRVFYPHVPEEVWRRNSIDYWRKVHEHTDPMVVPSSWMAVPEDMAVFRESFAGRPILVSGYSRPQGHFGTWHRMAGTNFTGHPGDLYRFQPGSYNRTDNWMNHLCSGEFAWNTGAPGAEAFTGWYYDLERDHTGPTEVIETWVPRAARAFFGSAIGDLMAPVFSAGVMDAYIMDPGQALSWANRDRRRPAADVDPGDGGEEAPAPLIEDSADRMAGQVRATGMAMAGMDEAYAHIDTLDRFRRKSFVYFHRRLPIWHMMARARHAVYRSEELEREGRTEEARTVIDQGLTDFEQDLLRVERVLEQTRTERDIQPFQPFHPRGDIRPTPEQLREMLRTRRADFDVVLRPREPGDVVRIGIFDGTGAVITRDYLARFRTVEAEIIDNLALATIEPFDCLILPNSRSYAESEFFGNLPRYVREGGRGVMIQHNMLGRARYGPFGERSPFPDIVPRAAGAAQAWEVVLTERHPATGGMDPGTVMTHMYYDHVVPEVGPRGRAIVRDHENNPVVVVGDAGLGRVVFDGNANLVDGDANAPLSGFNAHLVRHAVEWSTGVTFRE